MCHSPHLSLLVLVTAICCCRSFHVSAAPATSALEALITDFLESSETAASASASASGNGVNGANGADDYDLHYDQRQKGTENLRLSLDGLMVALPDSQHIGSMGISMADYLANLVSAGSDADDDDEDGDDQEQYGEGEVDEGLVDAVEEEQEITPDDSEAEEAPSHEHTPMGTHKYEQIALELAKPNEMEGRRNALLPAKPAAAAVSVIPLMLAKRPGKRVKLSGARSSQSIVQQSRTHPGRNPAKRRNKHKLSLANLIGYLRKRNV